MAVFQKKVTDLLSLAGVQVNGPNPYDIEVLDSRFYKRFLIDGRLGLGESYQDGWWECDRIDEMLHRIFSAEKLIVRHVKTATTLIEMAMGKVVPHGSRSRSHEIASFHYDLGNDFYSKILGKYPAYSCGYWADGAKTLEDAQVSKMDRICKKLHLEPGMSLLDIGCGWGAFAKYAAENYGVRVTGVSVSGEQIKYAIEACSEVDATFLKMDYRDIDGTYDRVASIGMFEHVGPSYYGTFFQKVYSCLKDGGLFLLHTLGFPTSNYSNPWLQKYIFPGGFIPSLSHVAKACEGNFIPEHIENIGYGYSKTLQCWCDNLERNWGKIHAINPTKYDDLFFRTWRYYLLATSAGFLVSKALVWHFVFSKNGVDGGYVFSTGGGKMGQVERRL